MCFCRVGLRHFSVRAVGSCRPSGVASAVAGSCPSRVVSTLGSGLLSVCRGLGKQHVPEHRPLQTNLTVLNILSEKVKFIAQRPHPSCTDLLPQGLPSCAVQRHADFGFADSYGISRRGAAMFPASCSVYKAFPCGDLPGSY